ncbi:MAG: CAP domain-containing protein [Halorientalis sp.]
MIRTPSIPRKAIAVVALAALLILAGCAGPIATVDNQFDANKPELDYVNPYSGTQFHPNDAGFTFVAATGPDYGTLRVYTGANLSAAGVPQNATVIFNGKKAARLFLEKVNRFRHNHSRKNILVNAALMSVSRARARHMKQHDYFAHLYNTTTNAGIWSESGEQLNTSKESLLAPREYARRGNTLAHARHLYPAMSGTISENINMLKYKGKSDGKPYKNFTRIVANQAFKHFLNSPPHRALLLKRHASIVGVGFGVEWNPSKHTLTFLTVYTAGNNACTSFAQNGPLKIGSDPCEQVKEFKRTHNVSASHPPY